MAKLQRRAEPPDTLRENLYERDPKEVGGQVWKPNLPPRKNRSFKLPSDEFDLFSESAMCPQEFLTRSKELGHAQSETPSH